MFLSSVTGNRAEGFPSVPSLGFAVDAGITFVNYPDLVREGIEDFLFIIKDGEVIHLGHFVSFRLSKTSTGV